VAARSLKRRHAAERDDIADLVTRRPLPGPSLQMLDPFLFLNHHGPQTYAPGNRGLPFGPHPHRGFETVTFILEGELAHLDSGGHESVIRAGGVQWMTAGSGLVHAEVSPEAFKRSGGPLEILQLWVNLPGRLKMTAPRYTGLQRDDIPVATAPGVTIQAISGEWLGVAGAFQSLTGVAMATVALDAGATLTLPVPRGRTVFLYVVSGGLRIGGSEARAFELVELHDDGEGVALQATAGTRLLLGHADPIGEPVAWHGPFVMTSQAEIRQAIADYQAGRFGGLSLG
jgi:redox-sensitive bicupin YhaK (pirin superfamily)